MATDGFSVRMHVLLATALVILTGCGEGKEKQATAPVIRPVRTVAVEPKRTSQVLTLTGNIEARYQIDVGFQVSGRIIARPVDVGTVVKPGDLLARLDPQQYQQNLEAAKADVVAAQAEVVRSQAQEGRQRELLKNGFTPQATYDQALKIFKSAQAQLDVAKARETQADQNVGYTEVKAETDGVITSVSADAGQVVGAGQVVVRLARPGEREAVFNVAESAAKGVPQNPTVTVVLISDPEIRTTGKVRYVSPQADPTTRTYSVRVSLPDAPPQMRLGANVTGSVTFGEATVVELPGSALFEKNGKPAVWLFDPKSGEVGLRGIDIARYEGDRIVVANGISQGDIVVTAGVQKLLPGQKVRLMDTAEQ